MIHVVSGYMRSGTSMMMKALVAGSSLVPEVDKRRDDHFEQYASDGYHPNPNGFYEFTEKESHLPHFPRQFDGKLIKCLLQRAVAMSAGEYRVLVMLRDPEEIRQSLQAFFGDKCKLMPATHDFTHPEYHAFTEEAIGILNQRRDMNVTVLNYRDVIENPIDAFWKLKIRGGWQIDPHKCAATIDPSQYRFRKELLTEGIGMAVA